MTHITIEYVIATPILISLIILFPVVANRFMTIWVDSRRTLALQDAGSHLVSIIQQLYFSLNDTTVPVNTTFNDSPKLPPIIDNYYYEGKATLRTVLDPALNSSKILNLRLKLVGIATSVNASVILGSNVQWQESTFTSNSANPCVSAQKLQNQTINLRFGA